MILSGHDIFKLVDGTMNGNKEFEDKLTMWWPHRKMQTEILLNITKFKYYNISYREYKAVYKNYIVCVYPFVIDIFEIVKPSIIEDIKYDIDGKFFKRIVRIHYQDRLEYGINPLVPDPCDTFEKVSGDRIHSDSNDCDKIKMNLKNEFYRQQIDNLNEKISHSLRKEKINKINDINESNNR